MTTKARKDISAITISKEDAKLQIVGKFYAVVMTTPDGEKILRLYHSLKRAMKYASSPARKFPTRVITVGQADVNSRP